MTSVGKMNVLLAIACLVSMILYLILPVLAVAIAPISLRGEVCLQIDGIFIVPLILMGLTLIISLLPIGPYNSIAGIIAAIVILLVSFECKEAIASLVNKAFSEGAGIVMGEKVTLLLNQLKDFGIKPGVGKTVALFLKTSWGITLPIILMFTTACIGLVLTMYSANKEKSVGRTENPRYSQRIPR